MDRQLKTPPGHVKERVYPKQVNQEGDVQRYDGLKAIKKDETIFAAYDKAEMRKAKIMTVANSDFVQTSKSLFWPDVIMLAAFDLDLMQSVSMAIGVQRQTEVNPITIVFAGINHYFHSRGFLSRLREPTTAEAAVWPAIKDILESMGEVVDETESRVRAVSGVCTSPGWTKVRVCVSGSTLGREIRCNHIGPQSRDRDGETETTQGRTTGGVVGYLERNERIQGPLTIHASIGRGAGVGTVQILRSTAQVEARNRRRPSSNCGDVE